MSSQPTPPTVVSPEVHGLSTGQQVLYTSQQADPANWAYHVPVVYRLSASTRFDLLQTAFARLVARHPILLSRLVLRDGLPQMEHGAHSLQVSQRQYPSARTDAQLAREVAAEAKRRFDLEQEPLMRVSYLERPGTEPWLVLVMHHLITDGLSIEVLIRDLMAFYYEAKGQQSISLPALEGTYTDFVQGQEAYLATEEAQRALDFWMEQALERYPSPSLAAEKDLYQQLPYQPVIQQLTLSKELAMQLRSKAPQLGGTPFSLLLSAAFAALHTASQKEHISLLVPFANRAEEAEEELIGYYMNPVLLSSSLQATEDWKTFVARLSKHVFAAYAYSAYPFAELAAAYARERQTTLQPHVAFYYHGRLDRQLMQADPQGIIKERLYEIRQEGEFDLTLEGKDNTDQSITFYIKYNQHHYQSQVITDLAEAFQGYVQQLCHNPEQLVQAQLALKPAPKAPATFLARVEAQVAAQPTATAVEAGGMQLSYEALWAKSGQIAKTLSHRQAARKAVAVLLDRDEQLLPALLGVLRAGAAFIPLDPVYPAERLGQMLEDGNVQTVITCAAYRHLVPDLEDCLILDAATDFDATIEATLPAVYEDDIAYTIFTSGSTGRPKGVVVSHQALHDFLVAVADRPGFTANDKLLAVTTVCFDIAYLELFLPLLAGGTVTIASTALSQNGEQLAQRLAEGDISVMQATPATWQMLLAAQWTGHTALRVFCGGEALEANLARALLSRSAEIWNLYGPTEATIWAAAAAITDAEHITLGQPLAHMQIHVLDEQYQVLPKEELGEIYLSGTGLAEGYLHRLEETRKRFVTATIDGETMRLYRTGDLGRRLADGSIAYAGRVDHQVKVRGYRIELGDIENGLQQVSESHRSVVVVRNQQVGDREDQQLIGFLQRGEALSDQREQELLQALSQLLPAYMIPQQLIALRHLPMTDNQKVDRKVLRKESLAGLEQDYGFEEITQAPTRSAAAETLETASIEQALRETIATLMHLEPKSITKTKLLGKYGFNSVSYTELSTLINQRYGVTLTAAMLYEYNSLQLLTNYIAGELASRSTVQPVAASLHSHTPKTSIEEPIAIVGMSGRYPGAQTLAALWEQLYDNQKLTDLIPASRWRWQDSTHFEKQEGSTRYGSFISDERAFDAGFFGISRREAELMDPQQRIMLELAWHCLEEAGHDPQALAGSQTGVYIGSVNVDYLDLVRQSDQAVAPHTLSGIAKTIIANRISFLLDLRGPSAVIDTACSSSLVAVHRAVADIRAGRCSTALVGGINLMLAAYGHEALSQNSMLSPDGQCKTFDAAANGYVRGEGAGFIYIKPLSQAQQDGDHIHAIIRATAENHGGKTNSLTAPNPAAQTALIKEALEQAQLQPESISYVEAHGTGTALGDPIEINALKKAWTTAQVQATNTPKEAQTWLGSIKANLGHLEGAAGIAGLHKTVLAMQAHWLPGNPQLQEPNPQIDLQGSHFKLLQEGQAWEVQDKRRAGISSFGFGGVNAHVIVEEAPERQTPQTAPAGEYLIALSAKSPEALQTQATQLHSYLTTEPDTNLAALAATLLTGRAAMTHRMAMIVSSMEQLQASLAAFAERRQSPSEDIGYLGQQPSEEEITETANYQLLAEISQEQLQALAQQWTQGEINLQVDTDRLQGNWRLSLPGYPFERESYWVTVLETPASTMAPKTTESASDTIEIYASHAWFQDHQVQDRLLLPGVAMLALSWEQLYGGQGEAQLQDIFWMQPLVATEGTQQLSLKSETQEGHTRHELLTAAGDLLLRLQTGIETATGAYFGPRIGLDAWLQLEASQQKAAFYADMQELGMHYGPSFQVVDQLWAQPQAAFAAYSRASTETLPVDVLDGALQISAYLMRQQQGHHGLEVPFHLGQLAGTMQLPEQGYLYAVTEQGRYHVCVLDTQGTVLLELQDLRYRSPKPKAANPTSYQARWVALEEKPGQAALMAPEELAIIYHDAVEPLANALAAHHGADLNPALNLSTSTDWLSEVLEARYIYFLGYCHEPTTNLADAEALEQVQSLGFKALTKLMHELDQLQTLDRVAIQVLSSNGAAVTGQERLQAFAGTAIGLVQTLSAEYPAANLHLLDVSNQDAQEEQELMQSIASAAFVQGATPYLALRDGKLYQRQLLPLKASSPNTSVYQQGDVYVIVGGTGGIGQALSLHMAQQTAVKLIWLSRSAPNETAAATMQQITALGSEVSHQVMDCADAVALQEAFTQIKTRYGSITGVIHAGMVLRNERFTHTDAAGLEQVLRVKVQGTQALYTAAEVAKAGFVMLFSSNNSYVYSPGQTAYAAASTFQDSFAVAANQRGTLPVHLINWGHWRETGAVASANYQQKLEELGLIGLSTAQGLAAIDRSLQQGISQLVEVHAQPGALRDFGFQEQPLYELQTAANTASKTMLPAQIELDGETQEEYQQLLAGFEQLKAWSARALMVQLQAAGFPLTVGTSADRTQVREQLGVVADYHRLYDAIEHILAEAGYLQLSGDQISLLQTEASNWAQIQEERKGLTRQQPKLDAYFALLETCLERYPDLLLGRVDHKEVMFPGGSGELVNRIYQGNLLVDLYNQQVARMVAEVAKTHQRQGKTGQPLRIFELGAGTGGTSQFVLAALQPYAQQVAYYYTDIAPSFVKKASRSFGEQYDFVQFMPYDLEQLPEAQGFATGTMDVLFATNVVHATRHIGKSLSSIKALMGRDGLLMLNELTLIQNFSTLTFGLTPGWWAYEDEAVRVPHSPVATVASWQEQMLKAGYTAPVAVGLAGGGQHIIYAYSDGLVAQTAQAVSAPAPLQAEPTPVAEPLAAAIAPATAPMVEVKPLLKQLIAEVLRQPAERLSESQEFPEMGIDSLLTMEVNEALAKHFGKQPSTLLFEHKTIHTLAEYLESKVTAAPKEIATPAVAPAPVAQAAGMSAEDIRELVADVLKASPEQLSLQADLQEQGLDSLLTIELNDALSKHYGKLPSTLVFEHKSIAALAAYLAEKPLLSVPKEQAIEVQASASQSVPVVPAQPELRPTPSPVMPSEERLSAKAETPKAVAPAPKSEDIAIIGLSGRYPQSENMQEYWEHLLAGNPCITEVPQDRWDWQAVAQSWKGNFSPVQHGGFLKAIDRFEADFFQISEKEAIDMDPQERLFLEETWKTLEDAGYPGTQLHERGEEVSVYVGAMYGTYGQLGARSLAETGQWNHAQSSYWLIANRVSHLFKFHGPSMAIDSACSASSTAIHLAVAAIRSGECSMALAGGVNLIADPLHHARLSALGNLSSDGNTHSFGKRGDGFVGGEGVGAVLLKPLSRAQQDKDHIYGIIKGSAANAGGYFSPDPTYQGKVVQKALQEAGVAPESISYVEAHGTGTSFGDPIELRGLIKAFDLPERSQPHCAVGTVKPNIGHLEAAAGISALSKVLLQLQHETLVPGILNEPENPYLALEGSPFYLQKEAKAWPAGHGPRRAGISSFGAGGSNVHLIVEEAPVAAEEDSSQGQQLILLSAKDEKHLQAICRNLLDYLGQPKATKSLRALAHTLQVGRVPMASRLSIVTDSIATLQAELKAYLNQEPASWQVAQISAEVLNKATPAAIAPSLQPNWAALAEAWLRGEVIDWEACYGDDCPGRISLPAYPFDGPAYWVPGSSLLAPLQGSAAAERPAASAAYPQEASFAYEDPFVQDHITFGKPVLLGVSYCSMALNAAANAFEQEAIRATRILFEKAAVLHEPAAVSLGVDLQTADEQLMAQGWFELAGESREQGAASLQLSKLNAAAPAAQVVIADWKAQATEQLSGEEMYSKKKPGIYGPALKTVEATWTKGGEVLAQLQLQPGLEAGPQYLLHPALIDGAITSRYALCADVQDSEHYLPITIKQLDCYEAVPARCYAHIRPVKQNEEIWMIDIDLLSEQGQVLAQIAGVTYKRVRDTAKARAQETNANQSTMQTQAQAELSLAEVHAYLSTKLTTIAALEAAPAQDRNFMDMGVSSVALSELSTQISQELETELYPTVFFEYPNLAELSRHLLEDHQASLQKYLQGAAPVTAPMGSEPAFAERRPEPVAEETPIAAQPEPVSAQDYVLRKLAEVMPTATIAADRNFMDMGVSSQKLSSLTEQIGKDLQTELYPTVFFEYPNVAALSEHLQSEHAEALAKLQAAAKPAEAPVKAAAPAAKPSYKPKMPAKKSARLKPKMGAPKITAANKATPNPVAYQPKATTAPQEVKAMVKQPAAQPESGASKAPASKEVAIIGMGAKMPGADNLQDFWEQLMAQKDMLETIPDARWRWEEMADATLPDNKRTEVNRGAFMRNIYGFDPLFFELSPREAELMDPQHRMALQLSWQAIEDAGYNPRKLSGSNTGVYIGVSGLDYNEMLSNAEVSSVAQWLTGNSHTMLTSRVSFLLNLRGPSIPVDTACSSSLVALHQAAEAISNGTCDMALAGGVNAILQPSLYVAFDKTGMLSPDGACKSFDKSANGFARGEGAGMLLLKSLEAAQADGDHIYAVIKGSAVNHGGRSNSLTAPNPKAQAEVVREAHARAGVDPHTVSYIEAHGTGTSLGDPIEIAGLREAFSKRSQELGKEVSKEAWCGISALKTNIGHLESAAGIAGLVKVLLCMKHEQLPGLAHYQEQNPYINLKDSPFYLVDKSRDWPAMHDADGQEVPRRAGISAFGFGGVNAHIVLEAAPKVQAMPKATSTEQLIVLSAKTTERLQAYAQRWVDWLEPHLAEQTVMQPVQTVPTLQDPLAQTQQLLADALSIPLAQVSEEATLESLGLDTINQYLLIERIWTELNCSLSTYALEGITVSQLAAKLSDMAMTAAPVTEAASTDQSLLPMIAQVLREGREAMPQRLAVVANSVEELHSKLMAFAKGESTEGLFTGEAQPATQEPLQKADLIAMAAAWVQGATADWSKLIPGSAQQKVPLPSYPFSEKAYFLKSLYEPKAKPAMPAPVAAQVTPMPASHHPMLQAGADGRSVQLSLQAAEYYFKDHQVKGRGLLPGVMYLELARMAGAFLHQEGQVVSLHNVHWAQPLFLDQGACPVRIQLEGTGAEHTFRISSTQAGAGQEHASGSLQLGSYAPAGTAEASPAAIKGRLSTMLEVDDFYAVFARTEFDYGPVFRSVQQMWFGEGELLAAISLPADLLSHESSYVLHPGIMDGALQAAGWLANFDFLQRAHPYIPASLGSLKIHSAPALQCYAWVKENSSQGTAEQKVYDISLLNEQGEVLVALNGYSLKAMHITEEPAQGYVRKVWQAANLPAAQLPAGQTVLHVQEAQGYTDIMPATIAGQAALTMTIPALPADFAQAPDEFTHLASVTVEQIIQRLASSQQAIQTLLWDVRNSQAGLQPYAYFQLMALVKARSSQPALQSLRQVLVLADQSKNASQPAITALAGFGKSLMREQSGFKLSVLSLSTETDWQAAVTQEIAADLPAAEVRFADLQREVKSYAAVSTEQVSALPEGQLYLVTGGNGSLGFQFAQHLIKRFQSRIVLTGRRPAGALLQSQLDNLRSQGAEISYLPCDISQRPAVEALLQDIAARHGALQGIFHFAGTLQDGLLQSKTAKDASKVLAPKVSGAKLLDECSRHLPLAYFVLASSITAELGNAGQTDYGYANAWLDAYAQYRSQSAAPGKSLSINWPLWKTGSMKVSAAQEQALAEQLGMQSMSTEQGMDYFLQCLSSPDADVLVTGTDPHQFIARFVKSQPEEVVQAPASLASSPEQVVPVAPFGESQMAPKEGDPAEVIAALGKALCQLAAGIAGIAAEEINQHQAISSYGFDSITLAELARQIDRELEAAVTPATFFELEPASIEKLAKHIYQLDPERFTAKWGKAPASPAAPVPAAPVAVEPVLVAPSPAPVAEADDALAQALTDALVDLVSRISGIEASAISTAQALQQYGFDSISLAELAKSIDRELEVSVTPATFFELPSPDIASLAAYLQAQQPERWQSAKQVAAAQPQPSPAPEPSPAAQVVPSSINPMVAQVAQPAPEPVPAPAPKPAQAAVAVVGIACQLPGIDDFDTFWELLEAGGCTIGQRSAKREGLQARAQSADAANYAFGSFIEGVDAFDADFFQISPQEARVMDPQQRLLLQNVWKLFGNAGYKPEQLAGSDTGVFVGVGGVEYQDVLAGAARPEELVGGTGNANFWIPNRISHHFNLRGPSEAIDTACSSASIALHQAIRALQQEDCGMAIAAGVNLLLSPDRNLSFLKAGLLSRSGQMRPFDEQADGFIRSEGVISVLLKPLAQAQADGNYIYASITGSATNHSGKGYSPTSPSAEPQAEVMTKAYRKAGVTPADIAHVEAHATSTSIGDTVELNAFKKAINTLQAGSPASAACAVGSVKSNVGHLEAAAGMASLLKSIGILQHAQIPATLGITQVNQQIDLTGSGLHLAQQATPLHQGQGPLKVSMHCYGAGGANAHFVLEAAPATATQESAQQLLFPFSAPADDQLQQYLQQFEAYLAKHPELSVAQVANTLQQGREVYACRFAVLAANLSDLQVQIAAYLQSKTPNLITSFYGLLTTQSSTPAPQEASADLAKVALFWCNGYDVALAQQGLDLQRVPLPLFPLQPKAYWIEQAAAEVPETLTYRPETIAPLQIDVDASTETILLQYLLQQVVRLTGLPAEAIEPALPWDELGVDSIMLARLKYELEREIDLQIPLRLLAETDSLQSLSTAIDSTTTYTGVRDALLAMIQGAGAGEVAPEASTAPSSNGHSQANGSSNGNGNGNGHDAHHTDYTVDDLKTIDWLYSNLLNDVDQSRRSN